METPVEARRSSSSRSFRRQLAATAPNNQVLLHDWWLIKADSDSHGNRLGIGGFTFKDGKETIRCFSSSPIVKRLDAVTLKTDDGMTIMLLGFVNKSRTLENGFSPEMCNHFLIGFPYDWEEYTDLSVSKEAASLSPALGTNKLRRHEANEIGSQKDVKTKGGNVEHSGPLTRSRRRLLGN